jgi:hypothetical protein
MITPEQFVCNLKLIADNGNSILATSMGVQKHAKNVKVCGNE